MFSSAQYCAFRRLGTMITETISPTVAVDDTRSTVSWSAVLAGAAVTAALTLVLFAFGVGVGFSVVSPWSETGVSATTFTISAGIYLIVVAMLSSTIGGYVAGRMRAQWLTVHEDERYFRDTAHGVLVWAVATIVGAAMLGGAATHIIAGASSGLAPAATAAAHGAPTDIYVDDILRADPVGGQNVASYDSTRAEVARILTPAVAKGGDVSAADRNYLAKVVAVRTGLPQAEAEQRVNQLVTQAKTAADAARKSAAKFSLWLVASMLAGALAAGLGAVEGGSLRNREWYMKGR
jgi:hypothetical protein